MDLINTRNEYFYFLLISIYRFNCTQKESMKTEHWDILIFFYHLYVSSVCFVTQAGAEPFNFTQWIGMKRVCLWMVSFQLSALLRLTKTTDDSARLFKLNRPLHNHIFFALWQMSPPQFFHCSYYPFKRSENVPEKSIGFSASWSIVASVWSVNCSRMSDVFCIF